MIRKLPRIALAIAATAMFDGFSAIAADNLCEREISRAASRYDVPIGVLYAVGLTETGKRGSLQPFAMNIEGRPFYALTVSEAVEEFERARLGGAKLIDIGCMQINHHYHAGEFASVLEMFDPQKNVDYAARFLQQLRNREDTWTLAVARYHAGPDNDPAQKRYVCAVIRNMVATGFGAWTEEAQNFCD